jgi:GrpB-like predicted nucleotidyltransferase (UPF0157 family)
MIKIEIYHSDWPEEFQQIAKALRAALGALAVRIDHIGSTSVPGLAAKDVIDIQISVAEFSPALVVALTGIGYSLSAELSYDHVPPEFVGSAENWHKLYFTAPAGQRRTHTHVRVLGRANQRYPLLFRDYLRCHPATAAAYAELKRRLADHLADPLMYPEVKDPAVDLIYLAAEEWAATQGWEMGPSDA